jgi:hypothetical protein
MSWLRVYKTPLWARLECKFYRIPEPATDIELDDHSAVFFAFR